MRYWYRVLSFFIVLNIFTSFLAAQILPAADLLYPPPKREMRAVWLATVGGLDWPKSNDPGTQQTALTNIFDDLHSKNFNAVVFQVRARGNAFYNSSHEPWAAELTGTLGLPPSYDPLQLAISLARQYNLELHAWFNFSIAWNDSTPPISERKNHVTKDHRDWFKIYTTPLAKQLWIDPGIPAARDWLRMVALDLVRNYDIDAIHFDFIRVANTDFPDNDTFAQYPNGFTDKAKWRRENINIFMRTFYDSLQLIKPRVKVGSAPIGIYRSITEATSSFNGWDLGQDSRKWMKEEKHDYVMPQIYWNIGEQTGSSYDPDFYALAQDWQNESYGRHVYPGLAAYNMASQQNGGKNYPISDIMAMIDSTRSIHSLGNVYFRYESLSLKNFKDSLFVSRYYYPALLPIMTWKDSVSPNPPQNFKIDNKPSYAIVTWEVPSPASDGDLPQQYILYRSTTPSIDFNDMRYVRSMGPGTSFVEFPLPPQGTKYYYAVTSLDKNQNESAPTPVSGPVVSVEREILPPASFILYQNYPNPFNPSTIISFKVPSEQKVSLRVYDVLGREITVLIDGVVGAGEHFAQFDGTGLSTGVYFYRFIAGAYVESKKMVLVR